MENNDKTTCTGLWLQPEIDVALEAIILPNAGVTAGLSAANFLHGICGMFALALSEEFGYDIEVAVIPPDDDDEDCSNPLMYGDIVHIYCVKQVGEGTHYIDVRGTTTDVDAFFADFRDELDGSDDDYTLFSHSDIKDFCCSCMGKAAYNSLLAAAQSVIHANPIHYKVA